MIMLQTLFHTHASCLCKQPWCNTNIFPSRRDEKPPKAVSDGCEGCRLHTCKADGLNQITSSPSDAVAITWTPLLSMLSFFHFTESCKQSTIIHPKVQRQAARIFYEQPLPWSIMGRHLLPTCKFPEWDSGTQRPVALLPASETATPCSQETIAMAPGQACCVAAQRPAACPPREKPSYK